MGKIALNVILLNFLKWAESTVFVSLIWFSDLLQTKLALSISERKELLLLGLGLFWGVLRIVREWVKIEQQRIDNDFKRESLRKEVISNDLEQEQVRRCRIENDLLEMK